jgi:carboxymethylenebutenolidase
MKYLWLILALLITACAPAMDAQDNNTSQNVTTTGNTSTNTSMNMTGQPRPMLSPIVAQNVTYFNNVNGYYVAPRGNGDYPGIILIHEWWGLNTQMRQTADTLANQGYRVLAVDLYNGKVATTQEEAMQLVGQVNQGQALANMQAALGFLEDHGAQTVGSWGYCFGGGQSANLALSGTDVDATVIYYGTVPTNASQVTKVDAPVFMVYGDQDTNTPASSAQQFKELLEDEGVDAELVVYEGVGHAFANPSNPGHDEEKTQDAWNKTLEFLNDTLYVKPDVTFVVHGNNFTFEVDGETNPELRVEQGDKVRVEFRNDEGFHDWVLDGYNVSTKQIRAGNTSVIEFIADKEGTFEYYCSVGKHREMGMRGNFTVE